MKKDKVKNKRIYKEKYEDCYLYYCEDCGGSIEEDDNYCSECGAYLHI